MSGMKPPPGLRLHQLEGFYWVAKEGGYARAVRALPYALTEPALHQQVRKLERALEVRLLEKVAGRRMVPTPAGRRLLEFVAPFFEGLPRLLHDLGSGGGSLLLGAEAERRRSSLKPMQPAVGLSCLPRQR